MSRKPRYIALGVVVLLTMIILNLPSQTSARFKQAVGSVFLPLFGLDNSTRRLADKAGDAVVPRSRLLKDNEALQQENQRLHLKAIQDEEAFRENGRLRQLLGFKQQTRWKLKPAHVVLWDPSNWWRTVQIDLGSRDGVTNNLPVLSPDGFLAGRVSQVSLTHSQVVLLGDPNCKVAALVEETRDPGTLAASDVFDRSLLKLVFPFRNSTLKAGQNVVTSGLGPIFPQGIPIGKIVDSWDVEYGLYTEARVKLTTNPGGLEEVWVLFP
jgi:rod shape-determining protein MreC